MTKSILELDNNEALEYFMRAENYFTYSLPKYITFQPILDIVRSVVGDKSYDECRFQNSHASDFDNVNYILLNNKDSKYSYRPLTIANPYLYYLTVKLITKEDNWKTIKERFDLFRNANFEVSSIPLQYCENKKNTATNILNWWENLEQRTIELSLEYKYMFKTDITNCYPSIYTHAIDWAISGKDVAKNNKNKKDRLGAQLDTFIRGFQYGQTNGIPQGSSLFDFIAELVLCFCDKEIAQRLTEKGITQYKILRYRDDYRIFSNSKEQLDKMIMLIQSVFSELNFQMNSSKTIHTEKIVRNAVKNDKLDFFHYLPFYLQQKNVVKGEGDLESVFDSYYKELYFILLFAEKHPNSGTVVKLLSNLNTRISKQDKLRDNIKVMIALVVEITLTCVRAHQISMSIISHLLKNINDNNEKKEIISNIQNRLSQIPNIGAIQIWLQRITYNLDVQRDTIQYDEAICKLIAGSDVELWNMRWIKPDLLCSFFNESIYNLDILRDMTPYIEPDEVEFFDLYHWGACQVFSEDNEETVDLPF